MRRFILSLFLLVVGAAPSFAALPTITFNNSTGSDTAASGSGGTAVTAGGNDGASVSSGTSVDLSADAPDLSGVALDGSAVIWVDTASGRQFSKITNVNDGTDVVTVATTYSVTASGLNWGIGGKRATWDNADSRTLFATAGAQAGWIIQTETNQTITSPSLTLACTGDTTTGEIVVQGSSGTPVINITANAATLTADTSGNRLRIKNLQLTNSNGTKTSAVGISLNNSVTLVVEGCILGDATNTLLSGITRASGGPALTVLSTEIKNCTGDGMTLGFTSPVIVMGCFIHDCAGDGIETGAVSGTAIYTVSNCIIHNNTGVGFKVNDATSSVFVNHCVFDGNGSNAISFNAAADADRAVVANSLFTNNGAAAIAGASGASVYPHFINYNAFLSNTGGNYSNITAGANNVTLSADPYTTRASDVFTLNNTAGGGAACRAVAFPTTLSGSTNYRDLGPLQHQDSGGSGNPPSAVGLIQ